MLQNKSNLGNLQNFESSANIPFAKPATGRIEIILVDIFYLFIRILFQDDEVEGVASDEDESSSDDDYQWRQEYKKRQKDKQISSKQPKFYELKSGEEFTSLKQQGDEKRKKT